MKTAVLWFFAFTLPITALSDDSSITSLSGIVDVVWGDPDNGGRAFQKVYLTTNTERVELFFIPDFPAGIDLNQLRGSEVVVSGRFSTNRFYYEVHALDSPEVVRGGAISGSKPWLTIPCKFSDVADEQEDLAFFQGMYDNLPGRLDHYWREASYDTIDVVGSIATDWFTLPNTQTSYVSVPGSGSDANLDALFDDCIAAAQSQVDFSNGGAGGYEGINLMFNGNLDCCAWGGGRFATLDGVSKVWRVTWDPPWAFSNEGIITHEMGHGFGLPHANNSDLDSNPYDSPWDVMSAATRNSVLDPVYGRTGKHINVYHKRRLGWIPDAKRFLAVLPESTITIDYTAIPSTANYRMARVDISDGSYYTLEVRKQIGDYEAALPGDSVIIHHILSRQEPSWVVDSDVPPANFSDNEGSMWKVGETFIDPIDNVSISIVSETLDGFVVMITLDGTLFADGFE